ncbi:hypothetical protein CLF_108516 [Clonorchis sinensis]|uniref:Uncharacterized protein n=1 Tax=Clonorchis sinensis TaxID=79923 RepID=G7YI69_CLOSI|nr:hypothetical protein CLF_108516 [Clonorchis sinensis]
MTLLIDLGNYRYCTGVNFDTRTAKIGSVRWLKVRSFKTQDWGPIVNQTTHLVDFISIYAYGHCMDVHLSRTAPDSRVVSMRQVIDITRFSAGKCWCASLVGVKRRIEGPG